VEQAFAKVEIAISRRAAASAAAAASSLPPPPTSTQQSGKTLIHTKIVQLDRESATTEKEEFDVKSKNHQVSKLEDSFMLAIKSNITEIGGDVLNLSATHAIIEKHLMDTKYGLPLSQNNYFDGVCDKEELCDSASIIHVPQLLNENDAFVLEPNTCVKNKHFLPITTERDELKLLSSLNTLGYIEFDTLRALSSLEENFKCVDLPWLSRCTYLKCPCLVLVIE
jgi:hypothetical protein